MQKRKPKFSVGGSISPIFFNSLREVYFNEMRKVLSTNSWRHKFHGETRNSLLAFPAAVAVWEAIINEEFTSDLIKTVYQNNLLFDIIREAEKWELKTKTFMFPKFIFGRTFDSSDSIFEDFNIIIQIRNNIVHYKESLYEGPDKAINSLRRKKVTFPIPKDVRTDWQTEIYSTECIRFCVNTISTLVKKLSELETVAYKQHTHHSIVPIFYQGITEEKVLDEFKKYNIDPSTVNDMFHSIKNTDKHRQ